MSEATTLEATTKSRYESTIQEIMADKGITNRLAAPRVTKVSLNMGVGRAVSDGQILNVVAEHLSQLAGQRATITKARKAIAQFRSRQGMKIGARVTLRGERMWAFLDRLIHLAVPRIKDFRGLSARSFDRQGNYNIGLREQALFPEVDLEKLDHNQGLNITICIDNSDPEISQTLLRGMGMPLRKR